MENHLKLKRNSKEPQPSGIAEKIISPRPSRSVKLADRFKSERPSLSYADFHHEIIKNSDDTPPKSSGNRQKQQIGGKESEDDELVKYMSNLPSYLQRGENIQEKVLNVGVLDWGRLEKWQNNHKQVPYRSRYSLSSSNTSSVFSTDGSSTHSSRGHSCSPAHAHQKFHRPSLQSHLKASPQEGYCQSVESVGGNAGKFQVLKASQSNTSSRQQKVIKTDQPFCKNQSQVKLEQCMIKDSDWKIIPGMGTLPSLENYEAISCCLKEKTKNGEFAKKAEKSDKLNSDVVDQDCPEIHKTVVLLLPRDNTQNSSSGVSKLSGSTTTIDRRSTEAGRRSSAVRSFPKGAHHAKLNSDIPHSCPLPCELDNSRHAQMKRSSPIDGLSIDFSSDVSCSLPYSAKIFVSPSRGRNLEEKSTSLPTNSTVIKPDIPHSCPLPCEVNSRQAQMKQPSSIDGQSIDFSSDISCSLPHSAKIFISPSRGRNLEEKKSISLPTNSTVIKSSEGLDLKTGTVAAAKGRNPSSIRRFSIDMGRISRIVSSKEGSAAPLLSSTHVTAKSGSERDVASACLDQSCSDKPNPTSRARSSPLRRLLDPLLKPKAANCHRFAEPMQRDLTSTDRACKSFDGQLNSSAVHSGKVKLDLSSCRSISVNEFYQSGKHTPSAVQALLRVAVKNGLPLFTFAVDNNSDILAATMRKLSTSRKDDYSCLYTFFTIREVKKKSWINQGGKGKGHDYVPNVVAQMKVSDSQFSNLTRPMDQFSVRQFVLLANQQMSGVESNDELAAIVVKIPKETTGSSTRDGQQSYHCCTSSGMRCSNSAENLQNQSLVGNQDCCSTTVILPSGVHSLPSKGEPSSLIERWISGGLCDCGGWDLGCKLRVLGNPNKLNKELRTSETCSASNPFELFSQGVGIQENQLVFSLSSFKGGIYSVEFNSSLSLLQAFSICIAVLESRKPSEHSEASDFFQGKISQETTLVGNNGTKVPNQVQAEVPARYASYPPHSPVGRV